MADTGDKNVYVLNEFPTRIYVSPAVENGTLVITVRRTQGDAEKDFDEVPVGQAAEYPVDDDVASCVHRGQLRYIVRSDAPTVVRYLRSESHKGMIIGIGPKSDEAPKKNVPS